MKLKRGLGSMSPEKVKQISAMGGRASQRSGNGHRFTHSEAIEAGRRGGLISAEKRRFLQ